MTLLGQRHFFSDLHFIFICCRGGLQAGQWSLCIIFIQNSAAVVCWWGRHWDPRSSWNKNPNAPHPEPWTLNPEPDRWRLHFSRENHFRVWLVVSHVIFILLYFENKLKHKLATPVSYTASPGLWRSLCRCSMGAFQGHAHSAADLTLDFNTGEKSWPSSKCWLAKC